MGVGRVPARPSSSAGATVKPGVPDGTMIVEISLAPSACVPVTAVTVTRPVMSVPELVMNALLPLMTHSSPSSDRRRAGAAGVGAAAGLGEPERAEHLAGAHVGQPLALLLLGAEPVDRHGAERHRGLQGDGHGRVDPRELLDGEAQREVVAALTAVLLGERQAEQAQLAHLPHDVVRERLLLVVLADHRRHDVVARRREPCPAASEVPGSAFVASTRSAGCPQFHLH